MKRMLGMAVLAGALLVMNGIMTPATAAGDVTGRFVEETAPAVWATVEGPPGEFTDVLVSPPVFAPLSGTVQAFAPGAGGRARLVASASTDADGNFTIPGLTANVYLKVVPSSPDWQIGWLWVEYMATEPGFASYVQTAPPTVFDVAPGLDVGMLKTLTSVASGRVVDLTSGAGIAGARVSYGAVDGSNKGAVTATTNASGFFTLNGLKGDEFSVRVAARRYVGGFVGCDNLLYPTWDEACSHGGGEIGVIEMARR